jgi:uncharacterized protein YqgV (UPF0045/DUF77 family)
MQKTTITTPLQYNSSQDCFQITLTRDQLAQLGFAPNQADIIWDKYPQIPAVTTRQEPLRQYRVVSKTIISEINTVTAASGEEALKLIQAAQSAAVAYGGQFVVNIDDVVDEEYTVEEVITSRSLLDNLTHNQYVNPNLI